MRRLIKILTQQSRSTYLKAGVVLMLITCFLLCLPKQLFNTPSSFVIEDEKGNLLGATIASDGQWRFPQSNAVPGKFRQCILAFEDKRFDYHPGIDPIALARAVWQNINGKKVISGGSTITMQVIRLSRGKQRNFYQKFIEAVQAVRLELGYSKKEILALYAGNAPFGSNVVGLDAAAWRYFGRSAHELSWAEAATLAVLPNAPSLVHPGKNQALLLQKRNRLLNKLVANNIIDKSTASLAKLEALPGKPLPLPMLTPHLLNRFKKDYEALSKTTKPLSRITTTINGTLQQNLTALVERYHQGYRGNGINNAAAMVMEVETGKVLAYVGNVYHPGEAELESHVDVLASPRSPGSTLKPLLFAAAQSDGLILPKQLIPDIPTQIGGYTPQNFNLEYDGAVPANRALSRSLNVPAVKMLQQYKYPRFYNMLQQTGFTTIRKPADFYGLSLILGGCEVTPWELAGVYSSMARSYLHQQQNQGKIVANDWFMPVYTQPGDQDDRNVRMHTITSAPLPEQITSPAVRSNNKTFHFFDPTSLWHTFNAMQEVMRPGEEGLWNMFSSAQRIAWKTGTSFGFRDGWAIGLTPKFCVVVWVGNTSGEGRPELTGITTAAPIMFDVFRMLPVSEWFKPPAYNFAYLPVCQQTGFKAGADCSKVDTVLVSSRGNQAPICPYHRQVHLDVSGTYRVTDNCVSPSAMVHQSWMVLPPGMEYYYRQRHPDYKPLPPYLPGCNPGSALQMELVYPEANAKIYVPIEITGERGNAVFTAAHRNAQSQIFWHLDDKFVGTTTRFHQLGLRALPGKHTLTIVDEQGERITRNFEILQKERS